MSDEQEYQEYLEYQDYLKYLGNTPKDPPSPYVEPSWTDAAKYVGESILEGGRNFAGIAADALNPGASLTLKLMGKETVGELINRLVSETGVATPDSDIVGRPAEYVRSIAGSLGVPGGPVSNALAAAGSEVAEDLGAGPVGQFAASLASAPVTMAGKFVANKLKSIGRAQLRSSLGLQAKDYNKSLRAAGLAEDEAGNLTTRLERSADEVIGEGFLPKFRTASGTVSRIQKAKDSVGVGIGQILSEAEKSGAAPRLNFKQTRNLIKEAPANTRKDLVAALDDFTGKITDAEYGWDGSLTELARIRSNIGADAFLSRFPGFGNKAMASKLEKAIYGDLTTAMEDSVKSSLGDSAVSRLKELNRKYGNYKTVLDPTTQALARESASNVSNAIKTGIRTSGGTGVPILAGAMSGNLPLGLLIGGAILASGTTAGKAITGAASKNMGAVLSKALTGGASGVPGVSIMSGLDNLKNDKGDDTNNNNEDRSHDSHFKPIKEEKKVPVTDMLLKGVRKIESGDGKNLVSPAGAKGPYQFMDKTWAEWSKKVGHEGASPFEEEPAKKAARGYLDWLLKKFGGDIELALTAYNAGPGTVDRALAKSKSKNLKGITPHLTPEAQKYADKVLKEVGKISSVV